MRDSENVREYVLLYFVNKRYRCYLKREIDGSYRLDFILIIKWYTK